MVKKENLTLRSGSLPFIFQTNPAEKLSFTRSGDAYSYNHEHKIFFVADSPLRYLTIETRSYPHEDHSYKAARLLAETFQIEMQKQLAKGEMSEEIFRKVLAKCNNAVKKLNLQLGKKYGDKNNYDLAEAIGFGAVIFNNTLYYGGLEDSYINVLRGDSLDNIAPLEYQIKRNAFRYMEMIRDEGKLEKHIPVQLRGKLTPEAIWEPFWCNHLRNNTEIKDNEGLSVGWGCFTGERSAEKFFQVHSLKLKKGDKILLFTNGMIPSLSDDEFCSWLIQNAENTAKFQHEMNSKIIEKFEKGDAKRSEKVLIYYIH